MAPSLLDRKRRFRIALALEGKTQDEWAKERGKTGGHVSQVLSGRESKKLETMIDQYVYQTFKAYKVRAA